MRKSFRGIIVGFIFFYLIAFGHNLICAEDESASVQTLTVQSKAFHQNHKIPSRFTCDGDDVSPDLAWSNVPKGTESYVVIVDDPDAPKGTWVHWVVYNIPLPVTNLPQGLPHEEMLANGELQGMTDFGRVGYGGPCPPSGTHRYFFKVYALDTMLDFKAGASKSEVEAAMTGHILAQGELMGKYQRKK